MVEWQKGIIAWNANPNQTMTIAFAEIYPKKLLVKWSLVAQFYNFSKKYLFAECITLHTANSLNVTVLIMSVSYNKSEHMR